MKVYLFDNDDTVEVSNGPVTLQSMMDLRIDGHIVGLCGNWGGFVQKVPGWQHLISLMNIGLSKEEMMTLTKQYIPAEDYIMVGNILGVRNKLGYPGGSDDMGAAKRSNWKFIKEDFFSEGQR